MNNSKQCSVWNSWKNNLRRTVPGIRCVLLIFLLGRKMKDFVLTKNSVNTKVHNINLKGEITMWSFVLRLTIFYIYFEITLNILTCPFFSYIEKTVNYYLNHVELNEVAQNRLLDWRWFFLKSSGKKVLQGFQIWKLYRKHKMCNIMFLDLSAVVNS